MKRNRFLLMSTTVLVTVVGANTILADEMLQDNNVPVISTVAPSVNSVPSDTVPPTDTTVPSTDTTVPPTDTTVPPTDTTTPPTDTTTPPTDTTTPPTDTTTPPTDTTTPPTDTTTPPTDTTTPPTDTTVPSTDTSTPPTETNGNTSKPTTNNGNNTNGEVVTPSVENPFITVDGYEIVGTENNNVVVKSEKQKYITVAPEKVGVKISDNGDLEAKDSEGKTKKLLPNTGTKENIFLISFTSILFLFGIVLTKKEATKNRFGKFSY